MAEKFIVETSARHVHLTAEAIRCAVWRGKRADGKENVVTAGAVCV